MQACCGGLDNDNYDFSSQASQDEQNFEDDVQEQECIAPEDNPFVGRYIFRGILGRGTCAVVYLVESVKTEEEFACKVVDKRKLSLDPTVRDRIIEHQREEILILDRLDHPNILSLVEFVETQHRMFIMTELLRGGDLFDFVIEKGTLSELEASQIVQEVVRGLEYVHSKGVIHRDLKPENLLLVNPGAADRVKIVDFGFSKAVLHRLATSYTGTAGYLAPELRLCRPYTSAVDIWALGVILYILLSGRMPFPSDATPLQALDLDGTNADSAAGGYKLTFPDEQWESVSASAKELITQMLRLAPHTRLTATEVLAHPWVTGQTANPSQFASPKGLRNLSQSTASRNPVMVTRTGAVYDRFNSFFIEPHTDVGGASSHRVPVAFKQPPALSLQRCKSFTVMFSGTGVGGVETRASSGVEVSDDVSFTGDEQ